MSISQLDNNISPQYIIKTKHNLKILSKTKTFLLTTERTLNTMQQYNFELPNEWESPTMNNAKQNPKKKYSFICKIMIAVYTKFTWLQCMTGKTSVVWLKVWHKMSKVSKIALMARNKLFGQRLLDLHDWLTGKISINGLQAYSSTSLLNF